MENADVSPHILYRAFRPFPHSFIGGHSNAAFENRQHRPGGTAFAAGPEPGRVWPTGYRRQLWFGDGVSPPALSIRPWHPGGWRGRESDPPGHPALVSGLHHPSGAPGGQCLCPCPALRQQHGGHPAGKSRRPAGGAAFGAGAGDPLFLPGGAHQYCLLLRPGELLRPGPGRPLSLHRHRGDWPQRDGPTSLADESGQRGKPGAL